MSGAELAWVAWSQRHAAIFGLTTDTDARMFQEWCALFTKAGFTPEELQEATEWLALHAPIGSLRSRADHLMMLRERVRGRRGEREQYEERRRHQEERLRRKERKTRSANVGGEAPVASKLSDVIKAMAQRQGISAEHTNGENGRCN